MTNSYDPMLATQRDESELSNDSGWAAELKWNGVRAGLVSGMELRLLGRGSADYTNSFPELLVPLPTATLIDGEVVVIKDGFDNYKAAASRAQSKGIRARTYSKTMPAVFMAFDLLWLRGENLALLPYERRKEMLKKLVNMLGDSPVHYVGYAVGLVATVFEMAKSHRMEGIVAKRMGSVYRPGVRSETWVKTRVRTAGIFTVVGYAGGDGRLEAFALADEVGRFAGMVGSGLLNDKSRLETFAIMNSMPDGPALAKEKNIIWKTTGQTLRVQYSDRDDTSGKLFHPAIVREDD